MQRIICVVLQTLGLHLSFKSLINQNAVLKNYQSRKTNEMIKPAHEMNLAPIHFGEQNSHCIVKLAFNFKPIRHIRV